MEVAWRLRRGAFKVIEGIKMKLLSTVLFLSVFQLAEAKNSLEIILPQKTKTFTLEELKNRAGVVKITVKDPVYKKNKTYQALELNKVLSMAGWNAEMGDEIAFICMDGYTPTLSAAKLKERKGYLAIRDTEAAGGWEKVQQGKAMVSPAPYYLVWESTEKPGHDGEEYPWPYQLAKIEVIHFESKFSRLFPTGVARNSDVFAGFQTFKNQCLRCHSMNLQGGDLGPELNVPKNITEYWSEKVLQQFIQNPLNFRLRSKMPPFPEIQGDKWEQLLSYFKWMREHKKSDKD